MERMTRKPLQGITNIIRFNWHFYVIAAGAIALLLLAKVYTTEAYSPYILWCVLLALTGITLSLAASFYVYDCSSLYSLEWLNVLDIPADGYLVNIHAGFDETSALLQQKYPRATLQVLDFYNPAHHTEVSIKRARQAYPAYPNTKVITTSNLSLPKQSADCIFVILSAHEIRNRSERIVFFKELSELIKEAGSVVVVEHLRNLPNFIAYTIGFLHFFSAREWNRTFAAAGLTISWERNITPFIRAFILQQNGTTP